MKQYFYLFALAVTVMLCSCGGKKKESGSNNNNANGISMNEKLGIKEVTDFYGGVCNFNTTVIQPGGKRVAKLEISKSPALESAMEITELNLSNIALVFYRDLQGEQKNFDEIQSSIVFSDNRQVDRSYSTAELDTVLKKSVIVSEVVNLLKDANYNGLDTILNDQNGINHYNKKKLIKYLGDADTLGKIKSFVPYGFVMITADNGKEVLHMSGMMMRDNHNNEFSVDIDPTSTKNEAIFINYKL